MRILVVTVAVLIFSFLSFTLVKMWGQSQVFVPYDHVLLKAAEHSKPLRFINASYQQLRDFPNSLPLENLYLRVTTTKDQKIVIPLRDWSRQEKPIRLSDLSEVRSDVLVLTDLKDHLQSRQVILNVYENTQAIHEIIIYNLEQMGFAKGENLIITSPYEAPLKALKNIAPALLYGSTQPEILKIVAMRSMGLLGAVTLRADVIIHPLKLSGHHFFDAELRAEMSRRHKQIVVGPINPSELESALAVQPFAIILNP